MSVIVSVDSTGGLDSAAKAIRVAAQEARYRETPLVAMTAYSSESLPAAPAARPGSLKVADDERASAEAMLRSAVGSALGAEAAHVGHQVIRGLTGRQFVAAARAARAELIVLAARGSVSLLPGAMSQYVLRHAPCPVLVVPDGVVPDGGAD
jgi:nucleotide-binding universal stress UspA family protein